MEDIEQRTAPNTPLTVHPMAEGEDKTDPYMAGGDKDYDFLGPNCAIQSQQSQETEKGATPVRGGTAACGRRSTEKASRARDEHRK